MSIYDAIANSGRDVGAGYLAGVKNKYALQEREQAKQQAQAQATRNAFVQDRAFELQSNQYDLQNKRYEAGQKQQATKDQMAFGKDTMAILSGVPEEQRQQAYMARVDEAARTVGLPEGFNPEQGWAAIQSQIPPMERKILKDVAGRQRYESGEPVFSGEPQPSALDTAKLRKEEALAQTAELKLQEGLNKAEAGQASADELAAVATSLLSPDKMAFGKGAAEVFGPFEGAMPSMYGETISAEARVDQLISLLTLENIDKMTGVLSDSDIKILKSAGTILQNKRIPDEVALKEIQKLAGGFTGEPEKPEAVTATNPQTGEKIQQKPDGSWGPIGG